MKAIICPVSSERIPALVPRFTALFVVLLLLFGLYIHMAVLGLLVVDFYLRGFTSGRQSVLAMASRWIYSISGAHSPMVDKAPKLFAARLGFVFSAFIFMSVIGGFSTVAFYLSVGLIVFALMECVFNFCVGCLLYSWFVAPYLSR
jgi:hypothetical protein